MNAPLAVSPLAKEQEPLSFRAEDGRRLVGRLFLPGTAPKAAAVLHGATGVPQGYYRAFAEWLASEGYACLTYDYRDFAASAEAHVRRSRATMSDWGLRDQAAAQAELERLVPGVPLWVIGHSLGGIMLPFQAGAARVERLVAVASGPVHLSDHPWSYRPIAAAFWSAPTRALASALGYLPGRAMRIGPDLPRGVYSEWRRWCTTRGFYHNDIGRTLPLPDWRAMRGRAKFVAIADDALVPPAAVWRLMQHYPEAVKRQLTLRPAEHGLRRIGHIAAFAERNRALWPAILAE
jgi:predicted alpha/beta hydrolase